jgi:hypothetical protein
MRDYDSRSFVYILSSMYEGGEYFLYVGESMAQYGRHLNHSKKYAYDYIYLFECEPKHLMESEKAVIMELCPLFNRKDNPIAERMKRILEIDYTAKQDTQKIHQYLERYSKYRNTGLFGVALPVAVFSALERKAREENCTCSELVQCILEKTLSSEIVEGLKNPAAAMPKTNLVTTQEYGIQHEKSPEQIKQYLHQTDRIPGTAKIGRDWVLPRDTKFPEDLRGNKKDEHELL